MRLRILLSPTFACTAITARPPQAPILNHTLVGNHLDDERVTLLDSPQVHSFPQNALKNGPRLRWSALELSLMQNVEQDDE
jgi:hypothetical protein